MVKKCSKNIEMGGNEVKESIKRDCVLHFCVKIE